MTEDRRQKTEDRGQKSDDRSQMTEVGLRRAQTRQSRNAEVGNDIRPRSENWGNTAVIGYWLLALSDGSVQFQL